MFSIYKAHRRKGNNNNKMSFCIKKEGKLTPLVPCPDYRPFFRNDKVVKCWVFENDSE